MDRQQQQHVGMRVPSDLVERIDRLAEQEHRSRTGQILALVAEALRAREQMPQVSQ